MKQFDLTNTIVKRMNFSLFIEILSFVPSGDERSVFSIVIYLNNGYSGGETVFYFPKDSSIESKGLDISEEIVKNLKYRNPVYLQLNSSNYYNLLQKIPFFYLMSILHPV